MNPPQPCLKAKGRRNIRKNIAKKLKKVLEERGDNVAVVTKDDILKQLERICCSRQLASLPSPNSNGRIPHERIAVVRPLPRVVAPAPEEADPVGNLQNPRAEPQIVPAAELEALAVEEPIEPQHPPEIAHIQVVDLVAEQQANVVQVVDLTIDPREPESEPEAGSDSDYVPGTSSDSDSE